MTQTCASHPLLVGRPGPSTGSSAFLSSFSGSDPQNEWLLSFHLLSQVQHPTLESIVADGVLHKAGFLYRNIWIHT